MPTGDFYYSTTSSGSPYGPSDGLYGGFRVHTIVDASPRAKQPSVGDLVKLVLGKLGLDGLQVTCQYCNSVVPLAGQTCPRCGGPLGDSERIVE